MAVRAEGVDGAPHLHVAAATVRESTEKLTHAHRRCCLKRGGALAIQDKFLIAENILGFLEFSVDGT